jgi:hypothetical protein
MEDHGNHTNISETYRLSIHLVDSFPLGTVVIVRTRRTTLSMYQTTRTIARTLNLLEDVLNAFTNVVQNVKRSPGNQENERC